MLIDTHAHINFSAYKDDGDEVVKKALENDVWIINSGSQAETSRRAVEYANKFPEGVYATIALHPIHLASERIVEFLDENETLDFKTKEEKFDFDFYKNLAQDSKVVAIGETGLDYYHLKEYEEDERARLKNLQKEVFVEHLKLTSEIGKPVVIHCREAYDDILKILKSTDYGLRTTAGGVAHSFVGRWSQAEQLLNLGFYLSFNGIITFARDYDKVVQNTPLERILLETDSPYLTPVPFRGKRNEPLYVKYVAEKIAEIKGVSFEEVAKVTTENARKLFKI